MCACGRCQRSAKGIQGKVMVEKTQEPMKKAEFALKDKIKRAKFAKENFIHKGLDEIASGSIDGIQ